MHICLAVLGLCYKMYKTISGLGIYAIRTLAGLELTIRRNRTSSTLYEIPSSRGCGKETGCRKSAMSSRVEYRYNGMVVGMVMMKT